MAKQAEAERERRAKVIHAEGEFQASQKLADAAGVMASATDGVAAALSAESGGNRFREKFDDDLSRADRSVDAILEEGHLISLARGGLKIPQPHFDRIWYVLEARRCAGMPAQACMGWKNAKPGFLLLPERLKRESR